MTEAAHIADADERMLGRLAELDLAAAERVHSRLMAAEEADEVADLGRAYQRLARSLRQTLALKAKLKLDRERAVRDAIDHRVRHSPLGAVRPFGPDQSSGAHGFAPPNGPALGGAALARLDELRAAALRLAWREAEVEAAETDGAEDAESATDIFRNWSEMVDEVLLEDGCADGPLDERLAGLCGVLGLDADLAPTWRDLPEPPPEALGDRTPPWRSSA